MVTEIVAIGGAVWFGALWLQPTIERRRDRQRHANRAENTYTNGDAT